MATSNIIQALCGLDGFIAAALIDVDDRRVLASMSQPDFQVDLVSLDNAQIIRARFDVINAKRKKIPAKCLFFVLSGHYHIVRQVSVCQEIFIYLIIDQYHGDLTQARMAVKHMDALIRI
jgi:hypothetical protein